MEEEQLTFILGDLTYRVSPHIWLNYPVRVGQVTVEGIRETISHPDIQIPESRDVTVYWKWFAEMGSGNYLKVVVRARPEIHLVITAHPDDSQRKREERRQ